MSIRRTEQILDVQQCIVAALDSISGSPWSDWEIVPGYPNEERFSHLDSSKDINGIIAAMSPMIESSENQQGGGASISNMRMTIYGWATLDSGGPSEIQVIGSRLHYFFNIAAQWASQTFTITIGSTVYTDTNLPTMGIDVVGFLGPTEIPQTDRNILRNESTLILRV